MKSQSQKLIEEIEARQKLKNLGYTFTNCKYCNGTRDTKAQYDRESCPVCRGEGGKWTGPLMC